MDPMEKGYTSGIPTPAPAHIALALTSDFFEVKLSSCASLQAATGPRSLVYDDDPDLVGALHNLL